MSNLTDQKPFPERFLLPPRQPTRLGILSRILLGIIFLLVAGVISSAILAATEFRKLVVEVHETELPFDKSAVQITQEGVQGICSYAPPFCLHWNGLPPTVTLVDKRSQRVIAIPVLSEQSLNANPNAVFWHDNVCEFHLESQVYKETSNHLEFRFEVLRPRRVFFLSCFFCAALTILAMLGWCCYRVNATEIDERLSLVLRFLEASTFLLIATLAFGANFPNVPSLKNGLDQDMISGCAAALDHPDAFRNDEAMGDTANFYWYTPLYIFLIRGVHQLGLHYGALSFILGFTCMLVALFGFSRLVERISGSPLLGFVSAVLLALCSIQYPGSEEWDLFLVLPRNLFTAFLPWILLVSLSRRDKPSQWWLPAILAGLSFYLHPVSAPALVGAILMGFIFGGPGKFIYRIGWTCLAAVVAVLTMLPYTFLYVSRYRGALEMMGTPPKELYDGLRDFFGPTYYNFQAFITEVWHFSISNPRYFFALIWTAALLVIIRRRPVRFFFGLLTGFAMVTYFVPCLDWYFSKYLGKLAFEVDLVRGIRYSDFILVCSLALVTREFEKWFKKRLDIECSLRWCGKSIAVQNLRVPGAVFSAIALLLAFYGRLLPHKVFSVCLTCLNNYRIIENKPVGSGQAPIETINVLRTLHRDNDLVLGPIPLRLDYIPLAITEKDLNWFAYTKPRTFLEGRKRVGRMAAYLKAPVQMNALRTLAKLSGARMLILPKRDASKPLLRSKAVLFRNEDFILVRLPEEGVPVSLGVGPAFDGLWFRRSLSHVWD